MSRTTFLLLSAASVACLAGCASPGPLRPPSLHLPEKAQKTRAERVAGKVLLAWTTPANTTDGDPVRGGVTASICREVPPAKGCVPVGRMTVAAGAANWAEALPASLTSGPPRLLAYRVELLNDRSRSAGPSDAVFAVAGPAPPPAGPLTIVPRRESALIQWKPESSGATLEVKRTLVGTKAGLVEAAAGGSKPGTIALGRPKAPPTEVTLRAGDGGVDRGGMIDAGVQDESTYIYVAQRVQAVTVAGHALEIRGEPSPPLRFLYRDVFPPGAPKGLVSVPGGGFGSPGAIDLSWQPSDEADVLGYNVYRREGQGEFVRLNNDPVPSSFYRDLKVEAGHTYGYRVTALDQRHNESRPGDEVRESLRQ